ncbi:MAG: TolC family protein [Candidatus Puniceispirillaceae bacterium]
MLKSTALVAVIITGLAGSTYGDEIALSPSGTDHQLAYDSHLPEVIIRSIYQDPAIRRSTARTCQAIYALGLRRAERRPEITAEVTGERELFSNFKRSNAHNDPSRAITRGYNSNRDNVYDFEVTGRYRLYDWGVSENRELSDYNRLSASRLELDIMLGQRSLELLENIIRLKHSQQEVLHYETAKEALMPHIEAITAQGEAGSIGLADVRQAKLTELDADVKYQRALRRTEQLAQELETSFGITAEEAEPLLQNLLQNRTDTTPQIAEIDWSEVRVADLYAAAARYELNAIENELRPVFDGVVTGELFDLTDFESEYQIVARLEMSIPLYDGGSNKARKEQANWRVRELLSEKESKMREHRTETNKILLEINRRVLEIENARAKLRDVQDRHDSLTALIGNSLVSRLEVAQLITQLADVKTELSQLMWSQEIAYARGLRLADHLTQILGVPAGASEC